LTEKKDVLLRIAEELLAREVLDADQVVRLTKGLPLQERPPKAVPTADEPAPRSTPERPALVPNISKPIAQE
jgi:hypothetical protein